MVTQPKNIENQRDGKSGKTIDLVFGPFGWVTMYRPPKTKSRQKALWGASSPPAAIRCHATRGLMVPYFPARSAPHLALNPSPPQPINL